MCGLPLVTLREKIKMPKEAVASKVSKEIKSNLGKIVKQSEYIHLTQSQVIEAILEMYFTAPHAHGEKVRGWIIEKRKRSEKAVG